MNNQEIFDTVTNHLIDQNKKSMDETLQCLYRDDKGNKCAIGCLISDEVYSSSLERSGVLEKRVIDALQRSDIYFSFKDETHKLLIDLQRIYDTTYPKYWNAEFAALAKKYGLQYNPDNSAIL